MRKRSCVLGQVKREKVEQSEGDWECWGKRSGDFKEGGHVGLTETETDQRLEGGNEGAEDMQGKSVPGRGHSPGWDGVRGSEGESPECSAQQRGSSRGSKRQRGSEAGREKTGEVTCRYGGVALPKHANP